MDLGDFQKPAPLNCVYAKRKRGVLGRSFRAAAGRLQAFDAV
jgi:hypothetical protein